MREKIDAPYIGLLIIWEISEVLSIKNPIDNNNSYYSIGISITSLRKT
jgi:hypothetical protein